MTKKYYPLKVENLTSDDIDINEIYNMEQMGPQEMRAYIARTNVIVKDALTRMMACQNPY